MVDGEQSITPLSILLDSPELRTGKRYNPENWSSFRARLIREDLKFRGVFPDQSVPSLLPIESTANPEKIRVIFPDLRQIGLRTIEDLRVRDFVEMDSFWDTNSKGRGSLFHKLSLSLWVEAKSEARPSSG